MLRQSYIFKYTFDNDRRYCLQHISSFPLFKLLTTCPLVVIQPIILFLHLSLHCFNMEQHAFLPTSCNQGTLDHCFRCNSSPSSQISISVQSCLICSDISGEAPVFSNCSRTRCFSLTWFTSDSPVVLVHSISP